MLECSQPGRNRAERLRARGEAETRQAPNLCLRMPDVSGGRAGRSLRGKRQSGDRFAQAEAELAEIILTLDTDFHTRLRHYAWALAMLKLRAAS